MIPDPRLNARRYQRYFVDLRALYQRKDVVIYTGLTLSLFAVAFFGLFALRPTLVTIASLTKEIRSKRETEQKLQTKINDLRQAQINYAQVASSVYLVNQALPTNSSLPEIIYQIEGLAQKNNLTLNSLTFMPVDIINKNPKQKSVSKTFSPASEIGFDLTIKGNYENIKAFLDSLEKLRRIIIVDSFRLNQTKVEEETTMNLNLAGRAFYIEK